MFTRRTIIAGSAAAVSAAALPAAAAIAPPSASPVISDPIRTLIGNIVLYRDQTINGSDGFIRTIASLNLRLLNDHPDIYRFDNIMTGAQAEVRGQIITAVRRKFATRWTLEVAIDGPPPSEADHEEVFQALVASIASEIRSERDDLAVRGQELCPFQPVVGAGVLIDPETFEPVMSFQTVYGIRNA